MNKCPKCNGSGNYLSYGRCFRCGGSGIDSAKGTTKYKVGDKIQHNTTKLIFVIKEVKKTSYKCDKYYSDGITLIDDITQLGKHIGNYPEGSKEGYTLLNR